MGNFAKFVEFFIFPSVFDSDIEVGKIHDFDRKVMNFVEGCEKKLIILMQRR